MQEVYYRMSIKRFRFRRCIALWVYLMTLVMALAACNDNTPTADQTVNATLMQAASPTSPKENSPTGEQQTAQIYIQQYLDDRSDPVQVLKSYYNAINRKEYVRAYYYWMQKGTSATSQPPAYPQFEAGYADTAAVQLTTATVSSNGAAGSVYYEVPVTLVVTHTNGSKHTFVGCYTIRQPNPKIFGAPPFIPMGIYSTRIQEVPNSANTTELMGQSCH